MWWWLGVERAEGLEVRGARVVGERVWEALVMGEGVGERGREVMGVAGKEKVVVQGVGLGVGDLGLGWVGLGLVTVGMEKGVVVEREEGVVMDLDLAGWG